MVPTGIPYKPKEYICLNADLVDGKPNKANVDLAKADIGSTCFVLDSADAISFIYDGSNWYQQ